MIEADEPEWSRQRFEIDFEKMFEMLAPEESSRRGVDLDVRKANDANLFCQIQARAHCWVWHVLLRQMVAFSQGNWNFPISVSNVENADRCV